MDSPSTVSHNTRSLSQWQNITTATLAVGYMGYYFCRSNFSIATPSILQEFSGQGIDKEVIGTIMSIGTLFYAGGKFFNGILCDFIGGRTMFIFGMIASILCTVVFGMGSGFAVFVTAWSINRLVQSMGWGALVKVSSNWFKLEQYGRVMGILCLSYLFGDWLAKTSLGVLLKWNVGWRGLFFASAAVLGVIAVVTQFLLKSSPKDVGLSEPPSNPKNLFGETGQSSRPQNLFVLLIPFLTSPSFWLVCVISFGLTLIREAFNFWTPTYLVEAFQLDKSDAAFYSALFPLFGGFSVLFAGYLTDRVSKGKRGNIMFFFMLPVVLFMYQLGHLDPQGGSFWAVVLICAIAFFMLAPYAFLTSVISLDLGGKCGSSTAAGIVDSVGYFGGILSGWYIGRIAKNQGWDSVFTTLAVIAAITTVACLLYWLIHEVFAAKETAMVPPVVEEPVSNAEA